VGKMPKRGLVLTKSWRTFKGMCLLLVLVPVTVAPALGAEMKQELDRYGGWRQVRSAATGWFRTWRSGGRWWLVDPSGHPFLSIGVNGVSLRDGAVGDAKRSPYGDAALRKRGSENAWAEAVAARLRGWGFNTLGAGADAAARRQGIPYVVMLDLLDVVERREGQVVPDVFDPAYETAVRRSVLRVCRPLAEDPYLIGYLTGEDPGWGADPRSRKMLLAQFVALDDQAPGRRWLLWFLEDRYLNVRELNAAWGTGYESFEQVGRVPQVGSRIPEHDVDDFVRALAQEYFRIARDAIRSVDDHHLILGCRFAGRAPGPVLEAMRGHVDVVSLSADEEHPPTAHLREIQRIAGRPVLIAEFGICTPAGNARGLAAAEEELGERYERYVTELLGLPMVVGYHWLHYADKELDPSAAGQTPCALVDAADDPYATFVASVSRANRAAYWMAAGEGAPADAEPTAEAGAPGER
jgi:hypothetical protein